MSQHDTTYVYGEPAWLEQYWVIKQIDPATSEVQAEFGYPTESAAWAAYEALTAESSTPHEPDPAG